MKNSFILLLMILAASCAKNSKVAFGPVYMGLNGKFSSVEITNYTGPNEITFKSKPLGDFVETEVYTFDKSGYLSEKCTYTDPARKVLTAKDTYKRDKEGCLTETYSGFNLNDNDYSAESLWRRIEKAGNKEKWQKIDENDWWGTSYQEIEYSGNKKEIKDYVIQKQNGKTSVMDTITQIFNKRGLITSEVNSTHPTNTTIKTYNDKGYLLKEEIDQLMKDGSINKTVTESYTIDKVDEYGNPLQATDERGYVKIYKYTYIK